MNATPPPRRPQLLRMELPSSLEVLPVVHTALEVFLRRVVRVPSLEARVRLPLVEAVVNAIRHGNRQDPHLTVSITLEWNPPELSARVEDAGEPFDPGAAGEPTDSLEDHGRGLFLMRRMTDGLRFSRGERGNVVELRWRVPSRGPAPDPAADQM